MINPLPVMSRSSRYWFLRRVGKLLLSGTRPVEVIFWIFEASSMSNDSFCGLVHRFLAGVSETPFCFELLTNFFRESSDQFCSLGFTLSNLYLFGCVYSTGFDGHWRMKCGVIGAFWPIAFFLASLPLGVRLIQSVKRYVDSGLITHLINVRLPGSAKVIAVGLSFYRAVNMVLASSATCSSTYGGIKVCLMCPFVATR